MKNFILFLIFIWAFSFSASSRASTAIKVEEVKLVDIEGTSRSGLIKSLTEDAVRKNSAYSLAESSPNTISVTLSRLEKNYLLFMVLKEKSGSRSRQLKLSDFDEIDTAVSRLTTALLNNQSLADTTAKGEVLGADSQRNGRVKSLRGFEVNVGAASALTAPLQKIEGNRSSHDPLWALGLGFAWDVDEAFMEMRWDLLSKFGSDTGTYNAFTLGGNYIWKDNGRMAFFSGGHFGFGNSSNSSYSSGSGFHFGADTGVLFFRQSDVNLELRLRYMILARQIQGSLPQLLGLSVGLHL